MEDVADAIFILKRAGWTVRDAAFANEAGDCLWFVIGHNGENLLRTVGPTRKVAWRRAVEQAKEIGMLGRFPWQPRVVGGDQVGQPKMGGK